MTSQRATTVSTRRVVAVVCAVAAVSLCAGAGSSAAAPVIIPAKSPVVLQGGTRHAHRVFVIGDSITVITADDLAKVLRPHWRYEIDGWSGITIAGQLSTIDDELATVPSQDWVVELGTNDVWQQLSATIEQFANEVGTLADQPCVILVTVTPRLDTVDLDGWMLWVSRSFPNFHLLDWGTQEYSNPAWVRSDRVHPTPAGAVVLADDEVQALDADCPSAPR